MPTFDFSSILARTVRDTLRKMMAPSKSIDPVANLIASEQTISEPNAAIRVRTFTLTPEAQTMLSTRAYTVPGSYLWNRYLDSTSYAIPADDLSERLTKKETEPVSPLQSPQVQPPPKQSSDIWDLI